MEVAASVYFVLKQGGGGIVSSWPRVNEAFPKRVGFTVEEGVSVGEAKKSAPPEGEATPIPEPEE